MSRPEVDGLNAGYAALLLEQYLDNPSAVPLEWRTLFESDPEALLEHHPGLATLVTALRVNGGNGQPTLAPPPPAPDEGPVARAEPVRPDVAAIAAAMSLVKAFRTHGHLAAHLDPLGSEPIGDPALDPEPLGLTPEVMAQIPADVLRRVDPDRWAELDLSADRTIEARLATRG